MAVCAVHHGVGVWVGGYVLLSLSFSRTHSHQHTHSHTHTHTHTLPGPSRSVGGRGSTCLPSPVFHLISTRHSL